MPADDRNIAARIISSGYPDMAWMEMEIGTRTDNSRLTLVASAAMDGESWKDLASSQMSLFSLV